MHNLVANAVRNISKLEHGSLEIKSQPCDLTVHVESVLRMLQQDMKNKEIECPPLSIDKDSLEPFQRAITDPLRYKQVVLNLMSNAIKFTALLSGSKQVSVNLSAKADPVEPQALKLICSVKDTGMGMSAEAIQKLFGKFCQVTERTHVEYGGSGLGLFISQRLAALLGGQITVESEPGRGSTFYFEIASRLATLEDVKAHSDTLSKRTSPIPAMQDLSVSGLRHSIPAPQNGRQRRKTSVDLSSDPHEDTRSTEAKKPEDRSGDHSVKTILVVEDNLINQKLMVKQLSMSGYRVLVGNHGLEALNHFKRGEHIDLVVTDIEMPVMNGVETLAAVRALSPAVTKCQPPFIACSAYARDEQRQAFIDAGMLDVLAKPHKFADLKACVEHVLQHRMPLRREYTL